MMIFDMPAYLPECYEREDTNTTNSTTAAAHTEGFGNDKYSSKLRWLLSYLWINGHILSYVAKKLLNL